MSIRPGITTLALLSLAAGACGSDGGTTEPDTSPPNTDTASTSDPTTSTITATTSTISTTTTATTTTPATTTETTVVDTETTAVESTTTAPSAPDDDTLDFLRRGLWSVPESDTRCGFDGAFQEPAGTITAEYQDPSDDGDFYVVCHTTTTEPEWPVSITLTDPSGASVTGSIDSSGEQEIVSGFTVTPLIVTSPTGTRFNGLSRFESDHVTQLHLWLPHDRRAGSWTVRLDGATASMGVRAPCATSPGTLGDPLSYPLDVDFLRHGGGNVTRHCLAFPDVEDLPVDDAVATISRVADLRRSPLTISRVADCGAGAAGTVIAQSPGAGSFPIFPFDFSDPLEVTLTVSSGPCTATTTTSTTTATTTTSTTTPSATTTTDQPTDGDE